MSDGPTGRELEPTEEPGVVPTERAVARREHGASSVERFTAGASAHTVGLTEERAAGIVRQSGNARNVAFLAVIIVVLFVPLYWFYDIGFPIIGGGSGGRLATEKEGQYVTDVSRGYALFIANCAQCHGPEGKGGGPTAYGPPLNDQGKLYNAVTDTGLPGTGHLNPNYVRQVLTVGGRYVCGNPQSQMPVWSNLNGGPLNYKQIEDLIAFITAPNTVKWTYDPGQGHGAAGSETPPAPSTVTGWRDPAYKPGPDATPVPDCWSRPANSAAPAGSGGAPSGAPIASPGTAAKPRVIKVNETASLQITDASGKKLDALPVKKGETLSFEVTNTASFPHNFYIGAPADLEANKRDALKGVPDFASGTQTFTYTVDQTGQLQFACTIAGHYPLMHGDLQLAP